MDLEMVSTIIKDIIVAIAAAVTAYAAISGLTLWRKQVAAKIEYELARSLLNSLYRLRDGIRIVRHPGLQPIKPAISEEKWEEMSIAEKQWAAVQAEYQRRWGLVQEAKSSVDTSRTEAQVVWGDRLNSVLECVDQAVTNLFLAVSENAEATKPESNYKPTRERWEALRGVLYRKLGDNPDQFDSDFSEYIHKVEEIVRPCLRVYHRI